MLITELFTDKKKYVSCMINNFKTILAYVDYKNKDRKYFFDGLFTFVYS